MGSVGCSTGTTVVSEDTTVDRRRKKAKMTSNFMGDIICRKVNWFVAEVGFENFLDVQVKLTLT